MQPQSMANLPDPIKAIVADNIIYLMGMSFILGSLFTILLLIVLDMLRLQSDKKKSRQPND